MRPKSQKWSLLWAVPCSIAFHFAVISAAQRLISATQRPPPLSQILHARLLLPPIPSPAETLEKNTLDDEPEAQAPERAAVERGDGITPRSQKLESADKKHSDRVLYPPEAFAMGLEGEAILLVELDAQGRIAQVSIGSSSGHAILDEAAIRYVREMGSLGPGLSGQTIAYPVAFRLR